MNRADFYKEVAKINGISITKAKEMTYMVLDCLAHCVYEKDRVSIKGLGTFKKKHMKERRIGDLGGKGVRIVPACDKIVFEVCKGNIGCYSDPIEDDDEEGY